MQYLDYISKLNIDLSNKTYIVTGANSGLGYETVKYLLYLNATVIMACRNLNKAQKAIDEIKKEVSSGNIVLLQYDQSSYSSIKEFANIVKKTYKIDGIVFNAGLYFPKEDSKTEDGLELTIGTNYFGQFMLFDELKEIISKETRLVIVTSFTGYFSKMYKLDEIDSLSRNLLYGYSKLLLSKEAYELNELGYKCVLVHPGICSTNILENKDTGLPNYFAKLGRAFLNIFTHSVSKAALTSLLGLVCEYSPNLYIKPRGLFAISGYPVITKCPGKYSSSGLLEETKKYLMQKVGNYVSSK